jgi:2-octaprenylphenol hydroxylase
LRTHHAKQYAVSRCVLVGDAAHTLHPLAGQGVNLGFLDVAALVPILKQAKEKARDHGEISLLKRYERSRKMHNQVMIWAMAFFKRGFEADAPLVQKIRNSGLNWVDQNATLKNFFAKMALGTMPTFPWLKRKQLC